MKDFCEVMKTITEGKGDLRDIYNQNPVPPPNPSRPRRMTPSLFSKKLFCPAFIPKSYLSLPREKRQQFDVLSRLSVIRTVVRMTRIGYQFVGTEVPSGKFGGRVDLVFRGPNDEQTRVEVKGSKNLKPWDIVQGILYHEPDSKIAIASLNDLMEPEEWLIETVKSAALELDEFIQEFPEQAAEIWLPHPHLCEKCANNKCPFKKPN